MNSTEQALHDKINLNRFVKRLETSITDDDSNQDNREDRWIKTQSTLQKVKYARRLLKNMEMYDFDPPPKTAQRYVDFGKTLDRVESHMLALEKRIAPKPTRPDPVLSLIPLPTTSSPPGRSVSPLPKNTKSPQPLLAVPTLLPTDDLLLSPCDASALSPPSSANIVSPEITLFPSTFSSSTTTTATTPKPKFLQNSTALQQELSDQLAQMATQLKRNAIHFSESLEKDQAAMEVAKEKIEGNYDVMVKERSRLRDHRGKSGSTTCLVMSSLVVVVVSFAFMFLLIRLTR